MKGGQEGWAEWKGGQDVWVGVPWGAWMVFIGDGHITSVTSTLQPGGVSIVLWCHVQVRYRHPDGVVCNACNSYC